MKKGAAQSLGNRAENDCHSGSRKIRRRIAEHFGLATRQIAWWTSRHNRKQERLAAAGLIFQLGGFIQPDGYRVIHLFVCTAFQFFDTFAFIHSLIGEPN